jgi:hypothetical protein
MYNDSLPELVLPPRAEERVRRGSYCGTDVSIFIFASHYADSSLVGVRACYSTPVCMLLCLITVI